MAGGTGTQEDPYLIGTYGEFNSALGSSNGGYYRITQDFSHGLAAGSYTGVNRSVSAGLPAKYIDGGGFTIDLQLGFYDQFGVVTNFSVFRNVTLVNCTVKLGLSTANKAGVIFSHSALIDVAVYLRIDGGSTSSLGVFSAVTPGVVIGDKVWRRVTFAGIDPGVAAGTWYNGNNPVFTGFTFEHCYAHVSNTPPTQIVKVTTFTLVYLDSLSSGAFTLAGWEQIGVFVKPSPSDLVTLNLLTLVAGIAATRMIWSESRGVVALVGHTDAGGAGTFVLKLVKGASFALHASEEMTADGATGGRALLAGSLWVAPVASDYSYIAQQAGVLGSLSGLTWGNSPVVSNGVTLNPLLRRPAVVTKRYVPAKDGFSLNIAIDTTTGSGGGPVIEGDPAYLDGYVEQYHPMLGTLLPMANTEVFAFERRDNAFVAMGSTFSNTLGEFRVDTEVYGGGDIFAFAADFPGVIWQAGVELNIGDRVRPAVNNGYVYEVITAGNSGATEPSWWADTGAGTEGAIGGATAKARPYYQPVGHGPLKMTLV